MNFKEELNKIIKASLTQNNYFCPRENYLKNQKNSQFGDYYTNIAFYISKHCQDSLEIITTNIINNISSPIIDHITITKKGIINFFIKEELYLSNLFTILQDQKKYGTTNIGNQQSVTMQILFNTSEDNINIFSINEIFSDNYERILTYNGYQVTKQYYSKDLETSSPSSFSSITKTMNAYRIYLDNYFNEQSLLTTGQIDSTINKLIQSGQSYPKDNCLCLKINNQDYPLITSDGHYTFLIYNISYHLLKYSKNYNHIITFYSKHDTKNILPLDETISILHLDHTKFHFIKLPSLIFTNNTQIITPEYLTPSDLLIKKPINEIRYHLALANINKPLIFNINTNIKNNITYIEYANARISKILWLTKKYSLKDIANFTTLDYNVSRQLIKKLYLFKEIVPLALNPSNVSLIARYTYDLAKIINKYYTHEKIIQPDERATKERIIILSATKIVLNNALNLIGIIPIEKI